MRSKYYLAVLFGTIGILAFAFSKTEGEKVAEKSHPVPPGNTRQESKKVMENPPVSANKNVEVETASNSNGEKIVVYPEMDKTPLSEYAGFQDFNKDNEKYEKEQQIREKLTAECMQDNGYLYLPTSDIEVNPEMDLSPEELMDLTKDPNEEHIKQLASEEYKAYYMALYGVPDPNAEDLSIDFNTGGGCAGEALRSIPGVFAARIKLAKEYRAMEEAIQNDPVVVSAKQNMLRCMEAKGYSSSPPDAPSPDDIERLSREDPEKMQQMVLDAVKRQVVSSDCLSPLNEAKLKARIKHEKEFVEKYQDVLERNK